MVDDVFQTLCQRYGEGWADDEEANLRFTDEAEHLILGVVGVHLIGDAELVDGALILRVWVDMPLPDLMSVDGLAYEIFGRICGDVFYAERRIDGKEVRYPFVTGTPRFGHVGALVLSGPHAAEFADRQHVRSTGAVRFHA